MVLSLDISTSKCTKQSMEEAKTTTDQTAGVGSKSRHIFCVSSRVLTQAKF